MPIPDYQSFMLPVLMIAGDGGTHSPRPMASKAADQFGLTEEQRNELLPSGSQSTVVNRVNWAMYYLYRAGLLERPTKGKYLISEKGREVLSSKPEKIDTVFLKQFESFQDFQNKSSKSSTSQETNPLPDPSVDPLEQLEKTAAHLKNELASELQDTLKSTDPYFFERVVIDLLSAMGYGGSREEAAKVTKASGDGGIDGTINEDRLGLDIIYVQAKRYQNTVPIAHIRDFAGALLGRRARKGVFITTSDFPQSAKDFVGNIDQKIILIDGLRLTELMIEHSIGVSIRQTIQIKTIDSDYFEES